MFERMQEKAACAGARVEKKGSRVDAVNRWRSNVAQHFCREHGLLKATAQRL
jgi:hypothetical protein